MKNSRANCGLAFAVLVVLLGCKAHVPGRPVGVPASAVWAGGADGGVFIECAASAHGEPNRCTVYNDATGEIWMKGFFVIQGQVHGARADQLKYDAADGERIYLKNHLVLVPYGAVKSDAAP